MYPDIAVIGGGVVGLTCAWRLAQGGARVVLFERIQTGREASWAAAGMLAPGCEMAMHPPFGEASEGSPLAPFASRSRDLYVSFAAELQEASGVDVELSLQNGPEDWRRPGIMCLAPEGSCAEARLLNDGEATEWNGHRAVWMEKEGQVEPRKLVDALRRVCLQAGVEIRENITIKRTVSTGGRVTAVLDAEDTLPVGGVVLCTGAWSSKMAGLGEVPLIPVRPVAGQVLALRADRRLNHVVYSDGCYLVPRRDGRLLVGATVEENGFHKRVTAGGVAGLLNAACRLMPELASTPLESHWAGLRPMTADSLPVIGPGEIANSWFATGHGRNGILLAPVTGETIADGILRQGEWPGAFSPLRFKNPGLAP